MHRDQLVFFLELLVLLVASRGLGQLFRTLRQPPVVGELVAGILIGPTVLGALAPQTFAWLFPIPDGRLLPLPLDAFTSLGVTLLMLAAGLEVDMQMLARERRLTLLCAAFASSVPLLIGVAAGYVLMDRDTLPEHVPPLVFALVMGVNLAMSALPVIARTLLDLGIYRSRIGAVILSAAMLDDVSVWMLFSLAISMSDAPTGHGHGTVPTLLLTVALLVGTLTVGRALANRAVPLLQARFPWHGGLVAFTFASGLAMACLAMWIGIHPVFGSLLAGVAIGSAPAISHDNKEILRKFIVSIFAPIFFASIGLRLDFAAHFDLRLVSVIFVLGCAGKIAGTLLATRLGRLDWRESFAVAFGLNSRGIMGIVLGLVALEAQIIDRKMFVALAVLGLGTSLLSGPMMRLSLGNERLESLRAAGD